MTLFRLIGLLGVLPALPAPATAQLPSERWRADDRVLISDVSEVTALARGPNRLFAATRGGLIIYDDAFERFELPLTLEDGYPESPVTAMTRDPRDGTLWLAAERSLVQVDIFSRRFVDRFSVAARVTSLLPAVGSSGELFAQMRGTWWRVDTFSRAVSRADERQVAAAVDRNPDLRRRREIIEEPAFRDIVPLLARRFGHRALRITDVMPASRPMHYWVGTDSGFLILYDLPARDWEPLSYGILGDGAAAVAAGQDGLWFAPRGALAGRFGVARVDRELQRWEVWDADSSRTVPGAGLRALLVGGSFVWAGGEGGLYRYRIESGEWQPARTLPGAVLPVLSLASDAGAEGDGSGVWAGTARGLLRLTGTDVTLTSTLLASRRILSLLAAPDRLWIGTGNGLYSLLVGDDGQALDLSDVAGPEALRRPVGALVALGDTVFAGLGREVWRGAPGERWRRVDAVGPVGGPVTALAVREGVMWVGSPEGLVVWDMVESAVRRHSFAAGDLPLDRFGARGVVGILPLGRRSAWLATPAGALWLKTEL